MKKHLLLLIKLLLISIATCSIGIVVSIWLIAREPIPSEVYVKYGIIGAVVGLWGGAGIWLQLYLQMRRYYRKQLLLRITCWVAVNGSRRKKPESMALMFSPVVIILPVKPVSGGRLKIKLMLPHQRQVVFRCYLEAHKPCGLLVQVQMQELVPWQIVQLILKMQSLQDGSM